MNILFGMPREKGRWIFVALGLCINLCMGSIYAWSVFVEPLTEYFSLGFHHAVIPHEILMPFSIYMVFLSLSMPLTGKIIELYGPRNVTIIGALLVGIGWILASLSVSTLMLSVTYGMIAGIGGGIAYSVQVAIAACWFPDRRGLAVGITILGIGFSTFFTAQIAGSLISSYGVMNTFRIFGVAIIILVFLLALPLKFPPSGYHPGTTSIVNNPGSEICEFNRYRMLKTKTFYGLFACYFIGCLTGLMAVSITQPIGVEIGIGTGLTTFLVGFFSIFNGSGRPVFGSLTDSISPRNTAMVTFALIGLASLLMWQLPGFWIYILSFALLWGTLGGWLAIAPTSTGTFFGTCDFPRCYGIVFIAFGAGALAGPQIAASVKLITGNYADVFPLVLGFSVIGIMIAYFLMNPPMQ